MGTYTPELTVVCYCVDNINLLYKDNVCLILPVCFSELLYMLWWEVRGVLEEGHILLHSLVDLGANATSQQQLKSLQIWGIHLHHQCHVSCLLVYSLNSNLWTLGHRVIIHLGTQILNNTVARLSYYTQGSSITGY